VGDRRPALIDLVASVRKSPPAALHRLRLSPRARTRQEVSTLMAACVIKARAGIL
jgi:hypothetical protein